MKNIGKFRLDDVKRQLWKGQEEIPLTPKQFDLLCYFVSHPGKWFKSEELVENVWKAFKESAGVKDLVQDIRIALGDKGGCEYIECKRGWGYRWVKRVRPAETFSKRKLIAAMALILVASAVLAVVLLRHRRPYNFRGRIAEIYLGGLSREDRTKLGDFVGNTYDYGGAAPSFLLFEHGVAVHFPDDQKSNPGSSSDHGFFIERLGGNGKVKWTLRKYPATTDQVYKNSVPAKSKDPQTGKDLRCTVVDSCAEPNSGFGAAWNKWQTIKNGLGEPVSCETNFTIRIQEFDHGFLVTDVPKFSASTCRETGDTYVESFVLFKDNNQLMGSEGDNAPLLDNSGRTVGEQRLRPYYDKTARETYPIWNCTPTPSGQRFCADKP
jgi:DNA-binding winged helix-turn-helix (wHTH) protein